MRGLCIGVLLALAAPLWAQEAPVYVLADGTGIELCLPDGFTPAEGMPGFTNAPLAASITVVEIPGPYTGVVAGFAKDKLAASGMELLDATPVTFGATAGMLYTVRQTLAQYRFLKWTGVFGDAAQTVMVTAMAPEAMQPTVADVLRAALLSARRSPKLADEPFLGFHYTLTPAPPLQFARRIAGRLTFEPAGNAAPTTTVTASVTPCRGEIDPEAVAALQLLKTPGLKAFTVETAAPVTLGGLRGIRLTAVAQRAADGAAVACRLAVLQDDTTCYLLHGLANADDPAAVAAIEHTLASFTIRQ